MREAARRHGMTRKPFGAQAPAAVADYLGGRATARELSPVPVRTAWTLGEAIDHVERQLFSWSWPYTVAQAAALADDLRGWAAAGRHGAGYGARDREQTMRAAGPSNSGSYLQRRAGEEFVGAVEGVP